MDPRAVNPDTEAIRDLVAECLDAIETRGESALEEACARHPRHAAELRRRIGDLRDVGLLGGAHDAASVPSRLGEFELLERLGSGGMGVVYRARQASLGREVALKLIRPDQHFFPGARERFRREIEAVAHLQHPGIAQVHAVGEQGGMPYFAMELVAGRSLSDALARLAGGDPAQLRGADLARVVCGAAAEIDSAQAVWGLDGDWVATCLRIALQAAEALEHAHRRGVLHRDVKPSNLMLTPAGRVVLLDFGLASRAGSSRLTRTGSQLGSLPYMAPEQLGGASEPGATVDVYGLGATLHEMLALACPFGQADTEAARRAILAGDAPSLRAANRAVTWEVATIVETAMELDPARRYASPEAMARDLRRALEGRPIEARPAGAWLSTRRWIARHPTRSVTLALSALVAIGGPLLYGVQESRARREVEDALEVAEERRREAQTARDAAERDYARALEAVRRVMTELAATRLDDVPQVQTLRAELLAEALSHYEAFLVERPGDVTLQREIALQTRNLASILTQLGREEEALARTQDLLRRLDGLLDARPDDDALLGALGSALARRAEILEFLRRPVEARAAWDDGLARLDLELERRPGSPTLLRERAALHRGLAIRARLEGDAMRCEEQLGLALEDFAAAGEAGVDADVREGEASAWNELAQLLRDGGRLDAALAAHGEARALREANVADDPASAQARANLGQTLSNLGFLQLGQDRAQEAEAVLRQGFEMAETLVRDYPDVPQYSYMLAAIGSNLAPALSQLGRAPEAERMLERALAEAQALERRHPGTLEYGLLVVNLLCGRTADLVEAQRWSEAEASERRTREALAPLAAALPAAPQLGFVRARLALFAAQRELAGGASGHALSALQDFPDGPFAQEFELLRMRVELLAACAAAALADERLDDFERGERVAHCAVELGRALARLEAMGLQPWQVLEGVPQLELLADHEELPEQLRASSR